MRATRCDAVVKVAQAASEHSRHRLPVGTPQGSPGADLHPSERSLISALIDGPSSPAASDEDAAQISAGYQVALGISVANWILGGHR